ncbi:MAG TPA: FKBP-type peptidyl-prolyl cis-trans isomerase [Candidatus Didemnitutus sp.]|nr:FKBP-type peptidyl-prolyl cis-trans isomerase [Candidatus Didemnitutus sp.]
MNNRFPGASNGCVTGVFAATWRTVRTYGILLILGLVLAFIAFQARTGIFRRANPGAPANKYTREMMEQQRLKADEQQLISQRYSQAAVTSSGLRYIVRSPGTGEPPSVGAEVTVAYEGRRLVDDTVFATSHGREAPAQFRVGMGMAIKAWDEAISTMRPGEKRTLVVPPWLAAENRVPAGIPPHMTLVFDVELIAVH